MESRSIKRMRMASRSGKAWDQNWDILRKCTASRSGKEEEEEQDKKSAELRVILCVCKNLRCSYYAISCYDDDKWSSQRSCLRIQFPFPTSLTRLFLGSSNGLQCYEFYSKSSLSNDIGTKCAVWEPSTNKLQLIPKPSSMNIPCDCSDSECVPDVKTDASGLWFDSESGDCKFVSFTQNCYLNRDGDDVTLHFHHLSRHAQVYSVKKNAWKELTYPLSKEEETVNIEIVPKGGGVCVNGVWYWHALCSDDFSFILSFNFVTEEFSRFHAPKIVDGNNTYKLVDLDGSLGVLIYPAKRFLPLEEGEAPDRKGIMSLMVYSSSSSSWSRVDGLDDVHVVGFHNPLWFGKRNGRYSLLLLGPQGVLLDYDYSRKVFNEIGEIRKMKQKQAYARAFAYEPKNNADIWHSSSFHQLQVKKRFAVYASHQT